jgi:hypothetical protein
MNGEVIEGEPEPRESENIKIGSAGKGWRGIICTMARSGCSTWPFLKVETNDLSD